jgi:hypothetical protein
MIEPLASHGELDKDSESMPSTSQSSSFRIHCFPHCCDRLPLVKDMDTGHQAITINHANLPKSDNVTFTGSSFFKERGAKAQLPTPAMVRAEAAKSKDLPGHWARKRWAVPFFSMKLVVKYGPLLSIAEGQCLWAIRRSLDQQVPVPEVYGWRRDGQEVFIYMQLAEGQPLEDAWETLAESDRVQIHRHLRQIVTSMRSLRQPSPHSFLGRFCRSEHDRIKKIANKFGRQYSPRAATRLHLRKLLKTSGAFSIREEIQ